MLYMFYCTVYINAGNLAASDLMLSARVCTEKGITSAKGRKIYSVIFMNGYIVTSSYCKYFEMSDNGKCTILPPTFIQALLNPKSTLNQISLPWNVTPNSFIL